MPGWRGTLVRPPTVLFQRKSFDSNALRVWFREKTKVVVVTTWNLRQGAVGVGAFISAGRLRLRPEAEGRY